jgi:peptide/nickel transport system substrate-binding protein
MRRVLCVSVLLLIALSPVTATGIAEDQQPESIVIGQIAEPSSLDPHDASSIEEFRVIGNVLEGLVRHADGSLAVEPALATAWEISEDGRTYTFELREGVLFHDGTPFNATAVKFSLDRIRGTRSPFQEQAPFPMTMSLDVVEETRILDEYTVQIILAEPFAPLLSNLANPRAMIVSPSAVATEEIEFGRNPVGTGPYRFSEWGPEEGSSSNPRTITGENVLESNGSFFDRPLIQTTVSRNCLRDASTCWLMFLRPACRCLPSATTFSYTRKKPHTYGR